MAYRRRRGETRTYTPEEWAAAQAKFGAAGGSTGRMRQGPWQDADDFATEMIRISLMGVTTYEAKSDILTPWKQQMREQREVYVASGVPDPAIRKGMYRRCTNPDRPELNCLSYDTEVLIRDRGVVCIGDLEGQTVPLLTSKGWGKGEIVAFGDQRLYRLVLRRTSNEEKVVLATANHRWFVSRPSMAHSFRFGINGHIENFTRELEVGQPLISINAVGKVNLQDVLDWKVVSVTEDGVGPTYCAVVPETEDFVLADGLLTGNSRDGICRPRSSSGGGALWAASEYSGSDESGAGEFLDAARRGRDFREDADD